MIAPSSLPTKSIWIRVSFRVGGPTSALTIAASPTTTMDDLWYRTVGPSERLTQGDIIFDCPLVS